MLGFHRMPAIQVTELVVTIEFIMCSNVCINIDLTTGPTVSTAVIDI